MRLQSSLGFPGSCFEASILACDLYRIRTWSREGRESKYLEPEALP